MQQRNRVSIYHLHLPSMAPLNSSNSSQMHVNTDENDDAPVELDRKWQSPPTTKKASAKSPTMPRRSDPSLDFGNAIVELSPTKKSPNNSQRSHSLSPRSMLNRKPSINTNNLGGLDMSVTSFTAFVEAAISPPPKMPHRRASTCGEDGAPQPPITSDGEVGKTSTWQSNHTIGVPSNHTISGQHEEFQMGLNDANGPTEKKKMRRVRRDGSLQRAFSDSELSEASTINSQKESKKERKISILKRRKERLAKRFLGRGKATVPDAAFTEEDDDVVDTDKDLEGFTGITLKKKSTHSSTDNESYRNNTSSGADDAASAATKTQGEIDVETRSRVAKSPIRFPGRERSQSLGRAQSSSGRRGRASGSSVATGATGATEKSKKKTKKKKSGSSMSRTKRQSNRKRASDDNESSASSSDEEYEKPPRGSSKGRNSKSPLRRRRKSAGARKAKKGGRKPIQPMPLDDDGSQRTMTDVVVNVPPTQEFVSPCTIGSGRRSVMDLLTPSGRSRSSKVSGITMSTGIFSPFTTVSSQGFNDDFSNHSDFTKSSLRGPQHIPDLEASERKGDRQANSLLATGNLSAVFENSSRTDGLVASGRNNDGLMSSGRNDGFSSARTDGLGMSGGKDGLVSSARSPGDQMGGTPRTPRSSLKMPSVPRRRPSSDDHSLSAPITKGPLFDSPSGNAEEEETGESFDRFAPVITKQRSSSDLMRLVEPPTTLLRKASSERNLMSAFSRKGAERVWRRGGKKKPQKKTPEL